MDILLEKLFFVIWHEEVCLDSGERDLLLKREIERSLVIIGVLLVL